MVHSTGFKIDNFFVPPFTVQQGEVLIIDIGNGPYIVSLRDRLLNIFSKRESCNNVIVKDPFTPVTHIEESAWQRLFTRPTVKKHIKNAGNPGSQLPNKIYDTADINPKTKINELAGTVPENAKCALFTFVVRQNSF
jgi:hypothetical protein